MEYNQSLHDVLYKFSSLDNYRDSIHYRDSFTATIVIVKFLLSLSTNYSIVVLLNTTPDMSFLCSYNPFNIQLCMYMRM